MKEFLKRMLYERKTIDHEGRELNVTGGIAPHEAEFMMSLIRTHGLKTCMETGVAYGVSTVAICEALSGLEGERRHYGIDPCQMIEFNGTALAALEKCGTKELFELMEGPSHQMLPMLLDKGVKLDFAFIDGWHTFDYTLIDVFYADKMLRPGGFMLVHDMQMPSKRKVWAYLKTHRRYRRLPGPARPTGRLVLSFGKGVLTLKPGNAAAAAREMMGRGQLLVTQKTEDWEPEHNFFRNF